jgi:hypothetical protein
VGGPKVYRFVIRGEVGDRFAVLFDGLRFDRRSGVTLLTGPVIDQAQLLGLVERTQELGFELISLEQLPTPAGGPRPTPPGTRTENSCAIRNVTKGIAS